MASNVYTFDDAAGVKVSSLPGIVVTAIPALDVWTELDGAGGVVNLRKSTNTGNIATALLYNTGAQSQYCEVTIGPGAIPAPGKANSFLCGVRMLPAGSGSNLVSGYNIGLDQDATGGAIWMRVANALSVITRVAAPVVAGDTLRIEVHMSADRITARLLCYHNGVKFYDGTQTQAAAAYHHAADRTGAGFYPQPTDVLGATWLNMSVGELIVDLVAPELEGPITPITIGANSLVLQAKAGTDAVGVVGHEWTRDGGTTWITAPALYSVLGLTPSTAYTFGVRVFDQEGFRSNVITGSFTTATQDTTPSVLTSPGVALVGQRGASGSITSSKPGMATAAMFPTAAARTHAEILGAQYKVTAQVLAGNNPDVFVFPALPALKTFHMHVAHSDLAIPANLAAPVVAPTSITTLVPAITATRVIAARPDGLSVIAGQQPIVEAVVDTFQLENASATEATRVLHRGGVQFAKGKVPTGTIPVVMRDGAVVRAQLDQRNYWSDGSLKFAVMHLADTDMVAAESRTYTIWAKAGNYDAPQGVALSAVLAALPVSLSISGHTAWDGTTSVPVADGTAFASLGKHATNFARVEKLHSGAVSDGWMVWGMVNAGVAGAGAEDPHLKCYWYVNVWKDAAGAAIDYDHCPVMAQDWWSVPGKMRRDYNLTYKDGVTTLQTYSGLKHIYLAHWAAVRMQDDVNHAKRHWRGAVPTLLYKPNKVNWTKSKVTPPYDTDYVPDALAVATYLPMSAQSHRAVVQATGAYAGRGMFSNFDAVAFMRQTASDNRSARVQAHAGLNHPSHFRDDRLVNGERTSKLIPLLFVRKTPAATSFAALGEPAHAYLGDGLSVYKMGYEPVQGGQAPWVGVSGDNSHSVNHSVYNYMLEGEPYMLMAVVDNATRGVHWQHSNSLNAFRKTYWHEHEFVREEMNIPDTVWSAMPEMGQQRSVGFGILNVGFAASLAPHNTAEGAYLRTWLREIGEFMAAAEAAAPPDARQFGGSSKFTGTQTRSHWMMAFAVMGCYQSARANEVPGLGVYAEMLVKFAAKMVEKSPFHTTRYHMFNSENSDPYAADNRYLPNGQYMVEHSLPVYAGAETGPFNIPLQNDDFITARYDDADRQWRLIDDLPSGTRFYAVQADGTNCKLSLTQGGVPYSFTPTFPPPLTPYKISYYQHANDTVNLVGVPSYYLSSPDSYGPITLAAIVYAALEGATTLLPDTLSKMTTYLTNVNHATHVSWKMKVGE